MRSVAMTTLIPQNINDQRLVLPSVTWQQYENLLTVFGDRPGLRLIYLEGTLEIFMPSSEHERIKKIIARLLERYAEEMDISLHGCGSTTFRQASTAQGLEPDESYCIGTLKELPDLAIEINLTSGGINKLAIYRGLGIPEVLVWQDHKLTLYDLRESIDREIIGSQFFPNLDLQLLARYIQPENQPQAIKEFLGEIRSK
jgi:Uma2 family endonuclease